MHSSYSHSAARSMARHSTPTSTPSSRGRGVVVPTQKQAQKLSKTAYHVDDNASKLPAPHAPPLAANALALDFAASQPSWRCARHLQAGPVQELAFDDVIAPQRQRRLAAARLLRDGAPLLLRGAALTASTLRAPGDDDAGITTTKPLPLRILVSPSDTRRFVEADDARNGAAGSVYHVHCPETARALMTFPEWLRAWRCWRESRLLLHGALVCGWRLGAGGGATLTPSRAVWPALGGMLKPPAVLDDSSDAAAALAAGLLDWPRLRELLHAGGWARQGAVLLEAGGAHALLPARYKHQGDEVIVQVSGRRRVLLVAPGDALSHAAPYPVHHPHDGYACVDFEDPETQHWPAAAGLRGVVAELGPGDALVVPAFTMAHTELMSDDSVALIVQVADAGAVVAVGADAAAAADDDNNSAAKQLDALLAVPPADLADELVLLPPRRMVDGALLLSASRLVEARLAAEVGAANVRRWLLRVARGRELASLAPALGSAAGYRRLRACVDALDMLVRALRCCTSGGGSRASAAELEARARAFCASMCVGRLVPTPWLAARAHDAAHLASPARLFLVADPDDDDDEEEEGGGTMEEARRYPQLFRRRLEAAEATWRKRAAPLAALGGGSGGDNGGGALAPVPEELLLLLAPDGA